MSEQDKKIAKSFTTTRFGFPVELKNVALKKVMGEWLPDVNANALSEAVLAAVVLKPGPWTGAEVKFVRLSQGLSQTEFGKLVNVTHAAVSKWESKGDELSNMELPSEFMLRFKLLTKLRDAVLHLVDGDGKARELTPNEAGDWLSRVLLQVEQKITPKPAMQKEPVGIDWRDIQQALPLRARPSA
jgi:DNA-binding transcriptional regulator YiaG